LLPAAGVGPLVFGFSQFVIELMNAGLDDAVLDGTQAPDQQTLDGLMANESLINATIVILLSMLYLFVTFILVQVIFAATRRKTFEEGNKRVAPKGPETPAL
jgi:hypothetical protein